MNCLEGIFARVVDNAIAIGNIHALRELRSDNHHVSQKRFILLRLGVHVDHRVVLERFGEHNEVDIGAWVLRWERDNSLVLKQDLNAGVSLDDLVKRRVFQLLQSHFCLLQLRQDLSVLWLGPPAAHCEYATRLAELREDQVAVLVEALQFLAQAAAQRERLNMDLKHKQIVARLHKLGKVRNSADILTQLRFRRRSDALVRAALAVACALWRLSVNLGCGVRGNALLDFLAH